MAYNSYFPTNYQPMAYQPPMYNPIQTPQPQAQSNGITWVSGEAGAKAYLVAPNTTVQLWDSEAQVIYLKSADGSGLPSMKILDYTIRNESPNEAVMKPYSEFASKVDVDSIKKDIEALWSQIHSMTEKGGEIDG